MKRFAVAAVAMLACASAAQADGFIASSDFSGGENVLTFNSLDMTSLGHPTANLGSGVTVTDSGGGTGNGAWRGNTDWSAYFDNIPGSSQGRALADSWGMSNLLFNFTGAGNPNRVGMLLSTGVQTTWTVRVYNPAFTLIETATVTMPAAQDACFIGFYATGGIGYVRVTDNENGFITIVDDLRFEHCGGNSLYERFNDDMIGWTSRWFYLNSNAGNYYVSTGNCDENYRGNNSCGVWITDTQTCGAGVGGTMCQIVFDAGFASRIQYFAFDLSAYTAQALRIYDTSGNIILNVPDVVRTNDVCSGQRYSVTSSNGISRIVMDSSSNGGGQIEGNTAWDNIVVSLRSGACDINQNADTNNSYMAGFHQPDLAQSFQHQSASRICGAGIELRASIGDKDTVTIELWDRLPNAGGTRLASGSAVGTQGQWIDVYWNPVSIAANTTYYLVFKGNTTLGISGDTSNGYPHGQVYANAGFQPFPNFDYTFRTYSGAGGGFNLSITGTCPGTVTVHWSNAIPNVTLALVFAKNTGSFVIPFGPCQGTMLGLGNNSIRLVNTFPSGASGSGQRSGAAGQASCLGYLQMHDIPGCNLSNVAQLP